MPAIIALSSAALAYIVLSWILKIEQPVPRSITIGAPKEDGAIGRYKRRLS